MDYYEFVLQVIEQQGISAVLLLFLIRQNRIERERLLSKICRLEQFIMRCLDRELSGSGVVSDSSPELSTAPQLDDLVQEGIIPS